MCDHCQDPREVKKVDVTKYGEQLVHILTNAASLKERLTGEEWNSVRLYWEFVDDADGFYSLHFLSFFL